MCAHNKHIKCSTIMQHCKMKQKNQKGYNFVQKRMLKIKIILQRKKKSFNFFSKHFFVTLACDFVFKIITQLYSLFMLVKFFGHLESNKCGNSNEILRKTFF